VLIQGGGLLGETEIDDNTIIDNSGPGIQVVDSSDNMVSSNRVTLNGSQTTGVMIEEIDGTATGNTISQNSMEANDNLGIDLGADGVTPNDTGDSDTGPNMLLNFPEDLAFNAGPETVTGTACTGCTVEVFATDTPSDTHGEGRTYLGTAVADGSGNFSLAVSGAPCGLEGDLTATATDAAGNTSEFAENVGWPGTASCPATPTPTAQVTPTFPATPGASPTPTATSQANAGDGDVNKDGVTNALDAALVLQNVAGLLPVLPNVSRADTNQDGEIDSLDALLILQYGAGLLDDLPV
jgi:parallel beta-helix repeat protein